jgi:uncharacterized protein (TIGR00297 family)
VILQFFVGLSLSTVVGLVGYWRESLTRSGVVGAILTGTLIFGFGGIVWGALLVAFFASSSALSHYRLPAKALLAEKFQKGSRRDLGQALANGGWCAALAAMFGVWHAPVLFAAFIGALATVTADTWATEIGVLSAQAPRLITTWQKVPVGTSGGVTALGTLTALLGAALIGGGAMVLTTIAAWYASVGKVPIQRISLPPRWFAVFSIAAIGGLGGSLFDSLLGSTVQAIYYCDYDRKETERRVHSCGRATRYLRGYRWMDNDVVNFLASVFGSGIAVLMWGLLPF